MRWRTRRSYGCFVRSGRRLGTNRPSPLRVFSGYGTDSRLAVPEDGLGNARIDVGHVLRSHPSSYTACVAFLLHHEAVD